jgi:hypothetical protein
MVLTANNGKEVIPMDNKALLLALNVLISDKEREIEDAKNDLADQNAFVERLQYELEQLIQSKTEAENS